MIAWPIGVARKSGLFDRVVVSTDDDEVAGIATQWGAEVPFRRPAALADDRAGTLEVMGHAVRWAAEQGWPLTAACCIYATAAFVRAADLEQGLHALESAAWAYAFTATDYAAPIFRSFRQCPEGGVEMYFPERFHERSQDLPRALHDAAQFYWGRPQAWMEGKTLFERHSIPILVPRWRVQDIDNEEDWRRAEMLAPSLLEAAS